MRGYFSDGSILNVTQQCAWSSSEPAVAIAPNLPGDRSRIDALSPGTTYVTCTDPASGAVEVIDVAGNVRVQRARR